MPTFLLFLVILFSLHIYLPICYKTYNLLIFNLNNYLSTQNCFEEPHNLNFNPNNFILLNLSYFSEFIIIPLLNIFDFVKQFLSLLHTVPKFSATQLCWYCHSMFYMIVFNSVPHVNGNMNGQPLVKKTH